MTQALNLPDVGLVLGTDGNFYGTAGAGGTNGCGITYRINSKGSYSVAYRIRGQK